MLAGLPEVRSASFLVWPFANMDNILPRAPPSMCFVETREANHWISPKQNVCDSNARTAGGKKTENFQAQFGRWFCTRNTGIFLKTEMCWWCCVSKIFAQRINVPTVFARKCSFRNWHFSILSGYHPCELGAAVCDALVERQKINGAEATLRWGQPLVNLRRKTTSFRKILFEWLMDGLMDWWIDGLMDWWIDGLMDWWIDGLIDGWIAWLIDWLFWLVHVVSMATLRKGLFPYSRGISKWWRQ